MRRFAKVILPLCNKSKKTNPILQYMGVNELKTALCEKLKAIAGQMDKFDRMQVAINLKIDLETVKRYTSGSMKEVRNLELAETILKGCEKVVADKTLTKA